MGFSSRHTLALALLTASLVFSAGCEEPGRAYPGPCRAEWTIYKVVEVGGFRMVTPLSVGRARVMAFSYKEGLLVGVDDDYDDDGTDDHRISLEYDDLGRVSREVFDRGADGIHEQTRTYSYGVWGNAIAYTEERDEATGELKTRVDEQVRPMGRIWQRCFGDCEYDSFENLLEDRDPNSQDVIRYFYDCWSP